MHVLLIFLPISLPPHFLNAILIRRSSNLIKFNLPQILVAICFLPLGYKGMIPHICLQAYRFIFYVYLYAQSRALRFWEQQRESVTLFPHKSFQHC